MFVSIYTFFEPRPWLARLIFIGSLALFILLGSQIHFEENINSMLPESKDIRSMNDVLSHTQAGEKLIFLASLKDSTIVDRDSLISLSNAYAEGLQRRCASWIDTLNLQAGSGMEEQLAATFTHNLPLFLEQQDYKKLDTLCQPEHIRQTLANNKKILLSPASVVFKGMVSSDPIGIAPIVWNKLSKLQYDPEYELYEGYIFATNCRRLSFFLKPKAKASETGVNSRFTEALNLYTDSFTASQPSFHIAYFGAAAVAAGNASQMRTDTIVTLSVTIILLMALCLYYFRRKRTPLLLLLPVLYGASMGLAVMYVFQGSISIIALGAGAIVMGIAMDYSIHFLSHTRETVNLKECIRDLQKPLTIGSFTTIAAFLSLRLVHLPLLKDLGLFAAVALIGAALSTLIFLPHFPLNRKKEAPAPAGIFDKMARVELSRNKFLLWGIVLLTPIMAWWSMKVQFDDDLMHLNYLSPRLKAAEAELNRASAYALSSQFLIGQGSTPDQALRQLEQASPLLDSLQQKSWIRASSNPTLLLSSKGEQENRINRWEQFWTSERKAAVISSIKRKAVAQGFSAEAFEPFIASLNTVPRSLDTQSIQSLKTLFPGGFSRDDKGKDYAVATLKIPPEHRNEVMKAIGTIPGLNLTDRQQIASRMVQLLNADFQNIAIYSSLIVFFALLIAYGRIELAIISFLPMAISWVWILGLMAMLGIKFNIVNIIISTLIFGLGDDYSIFTLDGLMERYRTRADHTSAVRVAVYVSVATVLIGLGALLLARHPALRSIAAISVTGMLCVLVISQTLQPALFGALIQRRANKGFHPFTAWSLMKSSFAFLWFVFCCVSVSISGIFLILLWPFNRDKGKLLFHRLLRRGTWSVLYIMGNVKKRVIHRELADFSKPAVYIANHSSFLDILLTTSLNPRLVLLTNKWVYRSPVFGAVVRMAEYYPVAEGAEDSLEPLRDLVGRGYSIIVFPEGTRSVTGNVQRFHKGAFYIAEQLKLDLVPLLIHGAHYTMQKGDWLLKDGELNVYVHPRISSATPVEMLIQPVLQGLPAYSLQAKAVNKWYREELSRVELVQETPSYFREQLIRSFTYKGPVLEWYCRIKTRLERNYERLHELLPRSGTIYDLGCGYGFAAYLLHWSSPSRSIIGVDYDNEKIAVANGLSLKDDTIRFECADLRTYQLAKANAIILSDVLHYLLPSEQEQLLEACLKVLEPDGVLILRDGMVELDKRQQRTVFTEILSTRVFHFNRTSNQLHFLSRTWLNDFAIQHKLALVQIDDSRMTSNQSFMLRKRKAGDE